MKIKLYLTTVFLFLVAFTLSSCEKSELLKSEKGVQSELEGTWNSLQIPTTLPAEQWIFSSGTLIRMAAPSRGESLVETGRGTYTVSTTMTSVKVKIEGFQPWMGCNGTWEVLRLDKQILVMNTDHDNHGGGLTEKNFLKN